MSIYAERTFDALAGIGVKQAHTLGVIHELVGREPVEAPGALGCHDLATAHHRMSRWPYLPFVHPSRVLPHLALCPQDTLPYLLGWLPPALQAAAVAHTGEKAIALPSHPLARRFIMRSWSRFLDALETAPELLSPQGELLSTDQQGIECYAQALSLYALEPLLKHQVERQARENLKKALRALSFPAIDFIRFLQKNYSQRQGPPPFQFPLHLWDRSEQGLQQLGEKFGFACLARLVADQPAEFHHELRLHMSESCWARLPQLKETIKPQIQQHLTHAFEMAKAFINLRSHELQPALSR